jgi:tRNA1Val (adenine37-N6)-methyltransferase
MSQPFRFKQFQVSHDQSTMKVGTDAVLLGSWAKPSGSGKILDIGTGSGVIALMMAQKSKAHITGIDIHAPSIRQANENFTQSPWHNRLVAVQSSIEEFAISNSQSFDYLISNPPFFLNSLKPKLENHVIAKHANSAFVDVFLECSSSILNNTGKAAFIIPSQLIGTFFCKWDIYGLFPYRLTRVYSKPDTTATRVMIEAGKNPNVSLIEDNLLIRDRNYRYTEQYKDLTGDFYLFLNE